MVVRIPGTHSEGAATASGLMGFPSGRRLQRRGGHGQKHEAVIPADPYMDISGESAREAAGKVNAEIVVFGKARPSIGDPR
ncbi:MAG: hypothetical protein HS130_08685 [Deltaproteobacteria bacterium]|nr:hypothetical protein [Deltaproteobacteria bacterium]